MKKNKLQGYADFKRKEKAKENRLKKEIKFILKENNFKEHFNKEMNKLLDSGYLNISEYDFKENGYQMAKLCTYLILKRIAEDYKPLDTYFMKEYKSLIKNY